MGMVHAITGLKYLNMCTEGMFSGSRTKFFESKGLILAKTLPVLATDLEVVNFISINPFIRNQNKKISMKAMCYILRGATV
jgi:hypothetical protein